MPACSRDTPYIYSTYTRSQQCFCRCAGGGASGYYIVYHSYSTPLKRPAGAYPKSIVHAVETLALALHMLRQAKACAPQAMVNYVAAAELCAQYLRYALTLVKAPAQLPAPVEGHWNNNIWPLFAVVGRGYIRR